VPVIFGNHYKKNPEADNLISANGGKSFENEKEASEFIIQLLKDKALLREMSEKARGFVNSQPNSAEMILQKMRSLM
jgi:3-deoxy-D-manno-octulosonic-acid transferase